jgi:hypothetical protein
MNIINTLFIHLILTILLSIYYFVICYNVHHAKTWQRDRSYSVNTCIHVKSKMESKCVCPCDVFEVADSLKILLCMQYYSISTI